MDKSELTIGKLYKVKVGLIFYPPVSSWPEDSANFWAYPREEKFLLYLGKKEREGGVGERLGFLFFYFLIYLWITIVIRKALAQIYSIKFPC